MHVNYDETNYLCLFAKLDKEAQVAYRASFTVAWSLIAEAQGYATVCKWLLILQAKALGPYERV